MNLGVINKTGLIDGSLSVPDPEAHPLHFSSWHRANSLVQSWSVNIVSPDIRSSLLSFNIAKDVWDEL